MKYIECFSCRQKGHSSNCPQRALFCMKRRINHPGESKIRLQQVKKVTPGVIKPGAVEGKPVKNILLDTGCSRTMVKRELVPEENILQGEAVAIRCAHGDTVLVPISAGTGKD